jgi:DNA-directed RNA polymerase subunit RPC12/RpoP
VYFSMSCSHCGKTLKVRDELVGRRARCPHCRTTITIARTAPAAADPLAADPLGGANPLGGDPVGGDPLGGGSADPFAGDPFGSDAAAGPQPAKPAAAARPAAARRATAAKTAPAAPTANGLFSTGASTNVNVFKSLLFGIGGALAFYALLYPIAYRDGRLTYLGRLFIGNSPMDQGGWVPLVEVLLFFWAGAMLVEKFFKIRRQRRSLMFDVLPTQHGETITEDNLDGFVNNIHSLPADAAGSFLVTRCLRGLEHFRARRSAADTATMLASQSEIDTASVEASYTLFHVFVWAIPILGFLGTVIGVSSAVGGFTNTLESSSDIGALKEGLKSITGGLGTAFDTTLIALSMAMILTFPISSLQKMEGDVLSQVDEYTNEYLLRRLEDGRGGATAGGGASSGEVQRLLEKALAKHRVEFAAWHEELKGLGTKLAGDLHTSWQSIDERQLERLRQTEDTLGKFIDKVAAIGGEVGEQVHAAWGEVNGKFAEEQARRAGEAAQIQEVLDGGSRYAAALGENLERLAMVIEQLGGQPILVEERPRRWWPFGARSNGNGR